MDQNKNDPSAIPEPRDGFLLPDAQELGMDESLLEKAWRDHGPNWELLE